MDLLEKFEAVEVKSDDRISEDDRQFCAKQQAAYESAVDSYAGLWRIWTALLKAQRDMLGEQDRDNGLYHNYLSECAGAKLEEDDVFDHIEYLHEDFIHTIVEYFRHTYCVPFDSHRIVRSIHPRRTDSKTPQTEKIAYQSVLEAMLKEMDGRSFPEFAIYQVKRACNKAVWDSAGEPLFERKKDTIRLSGDFCANRNRAGYYDYTEWLSTKSMDAVLAAMALYETDDVTVKPHSMSRLMEGKGVTDNLIEFSQCKKVMQMRMFKNGRVDVKFASAEYAGEFAEEYLDTVF